VPADEADVRTIWMIILPALLTVAQPAAAQAVRSLRIATEGAYPPFNYVDANNEPAGFEIDLGRAFCAAMAAECTFVIQDWDGMTGALRAGRFDAIMSSLEITPERARRIAFSNPYYRIPTALIGRKGGEFTGSSPDKLEGRTIGTLADSEFLAFLEAGYKGSTLKTYDKLEEATLDLLTERIDFVVGDHLALSNFLASREGEACCRLLATLPVDRGSGFGVGLRKTDSDLVARFNAAIAKVMADGSYDRIRVKYFPFDTK
jgi:polar amino acid transport system substrate-binding protein